MYAFTLCICVCNHGDNTFLTLIGESVSSVFNYLKGEVWKQLFQRGLVVFSFLSSSTKPNNLCSFFPSLRVSLCWVYPSLWSARVMLVWFCWFCRPGSVTTPGGSWWPVCTKRSKGVSVIFSSLAILLIVDFSKQLL